MNEHDDQLIGDASDGCGEGPAGEDDGHDLYVTTDANVPDVICDRNGQVTLSLCKRCGKAEIELDQPCKPRTIDDLCDPNATDAEIEAELLAGLRSMDQETLLLLNGLTLEETEQSASVQGLSVQGASKPFLGLDYDPIKSECGIYSVGIDMSYKGSVWLSQIQCHGDTPGAAASLMNLVAFSMIRAQGQVLLPPHRDGRIYIAGPMTGLPDRNFPAFNAEAKMLRAGGLTVINPAEHGMVEGAEWGDYLRFDLAGLATCEVIHLLPGWSRSKGANLEVLNALVLGIEVTTSTFAEPVVVSDVVAFVGRLLGDAVPPASDAPKQAPENVRRVEGYAGVIAWPWPTL